MKKNKSRQHRVPSKLNKRARRQRTIRRMEPLENRSMLAGDVLSAVHNEYMPHDVNNDGVFDQMDVDTLLTSLKASKTQQVSARGLLEGEQTLFLDIDNDGRMTNRDLLAAMNALALEGELADGTFSADVNLRLITTTQGNVDESMTGTADLNETFQLEVWVKDTSTNPSDIDVAYVDIRFDQTLVTLDPATGIVLGTGFTTALAGATPNNITPYGALNGPQDFATYAEPNTLRFIGGSSVTAPPTGWPTDPVLGRLVATLTFTTVAEGSLDFEVVIEDNIQSVDPQDQVSSFNTVARDGEVFTDKNVNATFFSGSGAAEISRWTGGIVSLDITAEPVAGANFDSYEVVEDYLEADAVPPGDNDPPVVTISGVQYYVLDVLENDLDGALNSVAAPRSRFNIDSVTQPAQGSVTIELDAQNVPEIVAAGIASHQVLLYQVPTGVGGISESFSYTMTDSGSPDSAGTTVGGVYVTITEVDQGVLLIEDPLTVEVSEGVPSGVIDIMDNVTPGEPSDVPTFINFFDENGGPLTAADLQGTFTPVLDGLNNPTGEFTYVSNIPGLTEQITYQVSDGNGQITEGTIIFKTLFDSLLTGVVYFDVDNDGVVDENLDTNASPEMRIGGVTLELLDGSGSVVATAVTDAYGAYSFAGFDAGTYSLRIIDPRFTRKGLTTTGGFTVSGNTISGIQVGGGEPGTYTGLNFGYRGRDYQYISLGDSVASNTEDSIILAFSKPGGVDSLEWYAVDLGWESLVRVRSDLSYFDATTGDSQIAFEVSVEGLDDPVIVVQAFSSSMPGYRIIGNGPEGIIVRINGAGSEVMSNLTAYVDAAFANM